MKDKLKPTFNALVWAIILMTAYVVIAQTPNSAKKNNRSATDAKQNMTLAGAGTNLPVLGSGTLGRLTKWTGLTSSNSYIADTIIFEDKNGLIGIGTDTPTSKLTVAGMIETTLGGYKFPDGTVQSTAAISGLTSVFHDATLTGNGTSGSPLGIKVPLILSGSSSFVVLQAINTAESGGAISALAGNSSSGYGGNGVSANGGNSVSFFGGDGVFASGGVSDSLIGGRGVVGLGGISQTGTGGIGIIANGGGSNNGSGGIGLFAKGGNGVGAGNSAGIGIEVTAGQGFNGAANGLAGKFNGNVQVTGNLSKGGGSFKIDHPLDPENKYLYHSFVESPDMMNIYNGNVTTDENGQATVTLPTYFEALNRGFRYQLTVIGAFAQAIIGEEINDNRFVIKTSAPNVKVSWQVTGVRQDAWANKNRIQVEVEKAEKERGFYLHPESFNQPEEKAIDWAHNPGLMKADQKGRKGVTHHVQ